MYKINRTVRLSRRKKVDFFYVHTQWRVLRSLLASIKNRLSRGRLCRDGCLVRIETLTMGSIR